MFRIPEVSWQGQNILVYDHVIISPPYKPENVKGTGGPEEKAMLYIKNIVSSILYCRDVQTVDHRQFQSQSC